jgi:hypothetical protein
MQFGRLVPTCQRNLLSISVSSWGESQLGSVKRVAPSTKLHGVTFNNVVLFIFTSVSNSPSHSGMCVAVVSYYAIVTANSYLTHVSLHATKVYKIYCKVSGAINPLIFKTDTRSSRVASSHIYRIFPGWQPKIHWIGGLVRPAADLDFFRKVFCCCRDMNPGWSHSHTYTECFRRNSKYFMRW